MTARSPSNLKEASRKESHVSMAIYYVCCIGASGCLLPFLGKTLERSGFSPGQMSLLLALLPISQFIFPPLWAAYADRYQRRTLLMGLSPILAALFAAAMALQLSPFFATVVIILGFCIFFTPVIPLADAHTNASVGKNLETFGRIRVWGSVAFAGCAGALGWLHISDRPQLQWLLVAGAYVLTAISSRLLKAEGAKPDPLPGGRNDDRQRPSSQDSAIPFGDQVKQYFTRPEVILIIAASTLYFLATAPLKYSLAYTSVTSDLTIDSSAWPGFLVSVLRSS